MTINVQQVFNDLANKKTDSLFQYLKEGGDANATNPNAGTGGFTPVNTLIEAATKAGSLSAIKALDIAGADINTKDFFNTSIKIYAQDLETVKFFESKGLVYENEDLSFQAKNIDTLKYLVEEKGLDPKTTFGQNQTLLHFTSDSKVVRYLVEEKGLDANASDQNGNTPLMRAAVDHAKDTSSFLQIKGADVAHLNNDGYSAKDVWINDNIYYGSYGGSSKLPNSVEPRSPHFDQDYADNQFTLHQNIPSDLI